ncbi:MAG TPA: gamma-glutamylcyclotransferase family protein [Candidatus Acidoferrales bacterium]|nr:gamma-glutamylcyclotransferase family protein [Candidatus Acidoferrales bacterium]
MLYFAYGSNMNWTQMQRRCPSARFVALAQLRNHRLAFPLRSKSRGCGTAGAVPAAGETVWGVVYEIHESEIAVLDRAEDFVPGGSENSYTREELEVYPIENGGEPLRAAVYLPIPQADPPLPSAEYKRLIVEGAKHWGLPADYIGRLEKVTTAP